MGKYIAENNLIKLFFDNEPDEITKKILKRFNWKYSSFQECWINKNTDSNINIAKNSLKDVDKDKSENNLELDYNTTVYIYNKNEHSNHKLKRMKVRINICNQQGVLQTNLYSVLYCSECNNYFIEQVILDELKDRGVPLIRLIKNDNYNYSLREESLLHSMGYNVSQKDGLTKAQRRFILRYIFENNYLSKDYIIYLLNYFLSNPAYGRSAHKKWKDDIEYLEHYDQIITVYQIEDPKESSINRWVSWDSNKQEYCLSQKQNSVLFEVPEESLILLTIHFPESIYNIIKLKCRCYNKSINDIEIVDDDGQVLDIDTSEFKLISYTEGDFSTHLLPYWWWNNINKS